MEFVRNSWYCVGWSDSLTDKPAGIRVLDQELVLFRNSEGELAALSGVCPHRFAPMSRGRVVGDNIQCGYHGLEFNGRGECVVNPGRGTIPPRARLRHFPAAEQDGAMWVWMGEPEAANPDRIFRFDTINRPAEWSGSTGYLKVGCGYELIIDNLLDLSHAAYIHPNTVGVGFDKIDHNKIHFDTRVRDGIVHSDMGVDDVDAPNSFAWADVAHGNLGSKMQFHLPSNLILDVSFIDPTNPSDGAHLVGVHFLTPASRDVTHYFYSQHRNKRLEDEGLTKLIGELTRYTFEQEDEPMLEACEAMMEGHDLLSLEPAILETDTASVLARRSIAKAIKEEKKSLEAVP